MLNALVSNTNIAAGRMIAGMLVMCLDHPVLLCAILAGLGGASGAVLFDAVAGRP